MSGKQKVLVVDDEENIRWIFKKALEKKGFEVHAVVSGEEALNKVSANDYLLVFSDIFLGGMDGIVLLEKVNEIKPNQRSDANGKILIQDITVFATSRASRSSAS